MKVIGIQRNVTFDMNGNRFSGVNLFFTTPKNGVDGLATEKVFVNSTKECYAVACSLKLGDEVHLSYNRFGKIDDIQPLKG